MEQILFYVFSGLAILSAIGLLVNVRNTVNAALSLVVCMLSLAVLFIMLHAEFVGVLQVMVYAGAIVVLFLFVVMLLNLRGGNMGAESQPVLKLVGGAVAVGATVKLATLLDRPLKPWADIDPEFGTVAHIGRVFYTDYMLAFQVAGVLLLAGIVAAVILAKREID
ncbi:MAG: NADH-quinone oxidoreductase subunit J [Deltaproteobacteria bacterium]|nr:NADH-quinone oxidoreductase subunit J [Deltaproteobacteria bacterium]MBW2413920.1 NADH-quinone oxidoreductase subunit J [Deltaproteobacteria bacterium]